MRDDEIERVFAFRAVPNSRVAETHQLIRDLSKSMAIAFKALVPACEERRIALRKIQEAMMFANSAIAQYSDPSEDVTRERS